MNYEEKVEIQTKLGRDLTWQERDQIELAERQEIKKYANHYGWTDVNPYEVVKTISPICVEIRAMKTVQTAFPKEFYAGGFVGHFADNRGGQKYEYFSDPEAKVFRIRWSNAKNSWYAPNGMRFGMADAPHKFYDYNF